MRFPSTFYSILLHSPSILLCLLCFYSSLLCFPLHFVRWKQAGNAVIATQRLSTMGMASGGGGRSQNAERSDTDDDASASSPPMERSANPLTGAELQTDLLGHL